MTSGPIEVRISELVLAGFRPADRERIASSARIELARLVESGGEWPASGGDLAVLEAGSFQADPGMAPEAVGAEVARAVYRRLGR